MEGRRAKGGTDDGVRWEDGPGAEVRVDGVLLVCDIFVRRFSGGGRWRVSIFWERNRERMWSSIHHGAWDTIRLYTAVDGAFLFCDVKGEDMERLMGLF